VVVGREAELSAVEDFLDSIQDGFASLLIEGEPGIGKTTVWQEAVRSAEARGYQVLTCRPAQSETRLSFAGLGDLLEPTPEEALASLPEPQRRALAVALLRVETEGPPPDQRTISVAFLSLVRALAAARSLLVAVDDAQWLDPPSARVLEFATRRLEREPIRILVSFRSSDEPVPTFERAAGERGESLQITPLSVAALHELIKARIGRTFARPTLLKIARSSQGNPFYALEIARALSSAEEPRAGEPLPLPDDLHKLVRERIRRLPAECQEALLVVSALSAPTLDFVDGAAIVPAEEADIVRVAADRRVEFTHPLFASAVYGAAAAATRRELHRRLAEQMKDVEERARHLALATEHPSEQVAAMLDEAAELAMRRGASGAAVELSELALARTPPDDPERRQDRELDLVDRLVFAGDLERAGVVARERLPSLIGSKRRVHVLLALSDLAMWSSPPSWFSPGGNPVSLAERALAEAGDDASLAARAHAALAEALESDTPASLAHARKALELIDAGAEVPTAVHGDALSTGVRCKLFLGRGLDVSRLEQAIELERTGARPRLVHDRASYKLAQWLKYVDEFDRSRRGLVEARREAEQEGDELSLVNILINLVILECWTGHLAEARTLGVELAQRFVELGWKEPPIMHVALAAALSGDAETVLALHDTPAKSGVYDVIRLRPLGLLALSQGDAEAAYRFYRQALELIERAGIQEPAIFRVHADAIESAIGAGELDEATRLTEAFSAHASRSSIPWNRVGAARSRALVAAAEGELDAAVSAAEGALSEHKLLEMPIELGRTMLLQGRLQRRRKQRKAARESLERALGIFEQLDAPLWADKARAELERTHLREAPGELTPSEEQIARLAASGLKNREIAERLFVSPKTVEANLARVYRKLGIRSRAELGATIAGGEPARSS